MRRFHCLGHGDLSTGLCVSAHKSVDFVRYELSDFPHRAGLFIAPTRTRNGHMGHIDDQKDSHRIAIIEYRLTDARAFEPAHRKATDQSVFDPATRRALQSVQGGAISASELGLRRNGLHTGRSVARQTEDGRDRAGKPDRRTFQGPAEPPITDLLNIRRSSVPGGTSGKNDR